MQSVSWNVRPSTSTGRCAVRRRALQERHGAQDALSPSHGPRAVRRAPVEHEIGVDARRRTPHARRSRSARRRTRTPDARAGATRPARVDAVLAVRALLAVVEDARRRERAVRAVLEHGEDRGVAALHVGRPAADHARALERAERDPPRAAPCRGGRPARRRRRVRRRGPRARCRGARRRRPAARDSAPRRDRRAPPLAGHAGDGDELEREHRQIDRLQNRFLNTLDHVRLREGIGRMRGQHQRVANRCPQRLAFVQQCHYDLSAIGIARPASIVDGIEIQERQHIGLLLHDLARRGTLDQEQGRRTGFNAVDNQRNRIVHRETDDRAGRGIVHLQNPRKRSLQMDRTGLQLQRSESGGEGLGIDRNALGLAQPFDAPETINCPEIRLTLRTQILTSSSNNDTRRSSEPSVAIVATTNKSASRN